MKEQGNYMPLSMDLISRIREAVEDRLQSLLTSSWESAYEEWSNNQKYHGWTVEDVADAPEVLKHLVRNRIASDAIRTKSLVTSGEMEDTSGWGDLGNDEVSYETLIFTGPRSGQLWRGDVPGGLFVEGELTLTSSLFLVGFNPSEFRIKSIGLKDIDLSRLQDDFVKQAVELKLQKKDPELIFTKIRTLEHEFQFNGGESGSSQKLEGKSLWRLMERQFGSLWYERSE